VDVLPEALHEVAEQLLAPDAAHGTTLALVVQHRGEVVLERYGHQPDTPFGPGGPVDAATPLVSWSMAKSITHALVGILVADGLVDPDAPAPVPAWRGTPKERITLLDLLEMRPGLLFVEDYVDGSVSHCLEMLFGGGRHDMAAYAAALPLVHEPGTVWNYSSGTTNIVARIAGDALVAAGRARADDGGRAGVEELLRTRLFGPAGMASATATFDDAGTFVGSSYVHATARDFARFGQVHLDAGRAGDAVVLPRGWVDHARRVVAHDDESGFSYGRHWWVWPQYEGSLACHGYEGQYTLVLPDRDLVVVHLGKSPIERRPPLVAALRTIADAFAAG